MKHPVYYIGPYMIGIGYDKHYRVVLEGAPMFCAPTYLEALEFVINRLWDDYGKYGSHRTPYYI